METQPDGIARATCPFADLRPEGCVCIALADNKRISADYQSRFCFTDQHVRCRRFQRAVPEIPDPTTQKVVGWIDDPRAVAAVAILSVILFLAIVVTAFHGTWSGWFSDNPGSTPTTLSAIGSTPTPIVIGLGSTQGSVASGTSTVASAQIPILHASATATASGPTATAPATVFIVTPTPLARASTPTPTVGTVTPVSNSTASTSTQTGPTTSTSSSTSTESNPATTQIPSPAPSSLAQAFYPASAPLALTPAVYTVQAGDTLFTIGQTYGVSTQLIGAANDLQDADLIRPGDQLFIPSPDGHLPPEAPLAGVHIVAPGDAMSTIAAAFGVSVQTLMDFNNIANADVIDVGTIIKIPKAPTTASVTTAAILATDVVQSGDTLYAISQRFGVSVEAIMAANNLSDVNSVRAGQVLLIPRM